MIIDKFIINNNKLWIMFGLSPKLKIIRGRENMEQDLINDLEGIPKEKIAKATKKDLF